MLIPNENIYRQMDILKTYCDQINFSYPMKLEEEEVDDFDEIEMLKKKQKEIKEELIKNRKSEDKEVNRYET